MSDVRTVAFTLGGLQIVEMQKMQGRLDKLEGSILHLDEEAIRFTDFDL